MNHNQLSANYSPWQHAPDFSIFWVGYNDGGIPADLPGLKIISNQGDNFVIYQNRVFNCHPLVKKCFITELDDYLEFSPGLYPIRFELSDYDINEKSFLKRDIV